MARARGGSDVRAKTRRMLGRMDGARMCVTVAVFVTVTVTGPTDVTYGRRIDEVEEYKMSIAPGMLLYRGYK